MNSYCLFLTAAKSGKENVRIRLFIGTFTTGKANVYRIEMKIKPL